MTTLFDRQLEILVGDSKEGIVLRGDLKIQCTVSRDLRASEPDAANLMIYNLNKDNRLKCIGPFSRIAIKAGYGLDVGTLFLGDIQMASNQRNDNDYVTNIIAGDGAKSISTAKLSKTYAAGVTLRDIIKDAGGQISSQLQIQDDPSFDQRLQRGKPVDKPAKKILDEMAKTYNFEWSVQNDVLVVIPHKKQLNAQPYLISPKTGMIGSPEFFDDTANKDQAGEKKLLDGYNGRGVKMKTFLLHDIVPGMKIVIESDTLEGEIGSQKFVIDGKETYAGAYKVRNILHTIDTDRNGGEFTTQIEAISLSA